MLTLCRQPTSVEIFFVSQTIEHWAKLWVFFFFLLFFFSFFFSDYIQSCKLVILHLWGQPIEQVFSLEDALGHIQLRLHTWDHLAPQAAFHLISISCTLLKSRERAGVKQQFRMLLGTVPVTWQESRRQGITSHNTNIHTCFYADVSSMKKESLQMKLKAATNKDEASPSEYFFFLMKVHNPLVNLKRALDFKYFLFFFSLWNSYLFFYVLHDCTAQSIVTENSKFFLFPAIIALENSITTGNSES